MEAISEAVIGPIVSCFDNLSIPQIQYKVPHFMDFIMNLQKLLANGILCDVILISKGKKFASNRIVLAACSEFFENMFTSGFLEKNCHEIELNSVGRTELEILLNFCHTGTLDINETNAENLLKSAHFMRITFAIESCIDFMYEHISISNCIGIRNLATHLNLEKFKGQVFKYCLNNFSEITNNTEYLLLTFEQLKEFLGNPDLNVHTEKELLDIIMKWIKYEPQNRLKYILELLAFVNLDLIPPLVNSSMYNFDRVSKIPLYFQNFGRHLEFFEQFAESKEFLFKAMKLYSFQTPLDIIKMKTNDPKRSFYSLLSWSVRQDIFRIYNQELNDWEECNLLKPKLGKSSKVLGLHIDKNILYVVKKIKMITIEFYYIKTCELPYKKIETQFSEATIAICFPYLYLLEKRNMHNFNLLTSETTTLSTGWRQYFTYNGLAVVNDNFYILALTEGRINEMYCVDPKTNFFSQCAKACKDFSEYMQVAVLKDDIYIFENVSKNDVRRVERYNTKSDTWTSIAGLNNICDFTVCIWKDTLVTLSIISEIGRIFVSKYNVTQDKWESLSNSISSPSPTEAMVSFYSSFHKRIDDHNRRPLSYPSNLLTTVLNDVLGIRYTL